MQSNLHILIICNKLSITPDKVHLSRIMVYNVLKINHINQIISPKDTTHVYHWYVQFLFRMVFFLFDQTSMTTRASLEIFEIPDSNADLDAWPGPTYF